MNKLFRFFKDTRTVVSENLQDNKTNVVPKAADQSYFSVIAYNNLMEIVTFVPLYDRRVLLGVCQVLRRAVIDVCREEGFCLLRRKVSKRDDYVELLNMYFSENGEYKNGLPLICIEFHEGLGACDKVFRNDRVEWFKGSFLNPFGKNKRGSLIELKSMGSVLSCKTDEFSMFESMPSNENIDHLELGEVFGTLDCCKAKNLKELNVDFLSMFGKLKLGPSVKMVRINDAWGEIRVDKAKALKAITIERMDCAKNANLKFCASVEKVSIKYFGNRWGGKLINISMREARHLKSVELDVIGDYIDVDLGSKPSENLNLGIIRGKLYVRQGEGGFSDEDIETLKKKCYDGGQVIGYW